MEHLDDAFVIEAGEPLILRGAEAVIHLAANADVRNGWDHPFRDLNHNTVFTARLLDEMRAQRVHRLLFASSSAVYGDAPIPTPETYSGQQTSLYGASKLAGEGLIGAYAASGHVSATVLRLTSMLGRYYRHGLVVDFMRQAREGAIHVLGGGSVPRTRMHVEDGVNAFLHRLREDPGYEVFNVGTDETITSLEVAQIVADEMRADVPITTIPESWVGDHPILLDCTKLRETGWSPKWTIDAAVRDTVRWPM